MTMRMVTLGNVRHEPWRNGGGTTRSLVAWPETLTWRVRVSVADIEQSGAFSSFPGVERWFAVVEGSGLQLTVDEHVHTLVTHDAPLRFDGAAKTHAKLLEGSTRDLNLMIDRGHGVMHAVHPQEPWQPGQTHFVALFAWQAGRLVMDDGDAMPLVVPAQTLVWWSVEGRGPGALRFTPDDSHNTSGRAATRAWWLAATLDAPSTHRSGAI